MIQLEIGNSYSRITGLSASEEKELKTLFSYVVGGTSSYFSSYGPKRKSLLDKKGMFPTGLYMRMYKWLTANKILFNLHYPTYPKVLKRKVFYDAYEWQNTALKKAYNQHRGSITAPTGTGKSKCMGMFAESFNLKTLWIVPSLEIKTQTIVNYGHLKNVTITNIDDPKLLKMTDFDMLLIDECHRVAAKTYHKLNKLAWNGIYYRYNFSATTFRNDDEETLLYESIAGQEIYRLTYTEAVAKNYIVPIESYYIEVPKVKTDAFTYREVYDELVVHNTPANMIIASALTMLHSSQKSTLCLVKEVLHGQILADLTGLHFVSGQDAASRKYIQRFNKGEIKVLIGTEAILGEGIDTKPCEFVVIAGSGKAKSQFMQKVGRCVRTFPGKESGKVILIRNKSHRFLTRHFAAQCAILREEYNSKPGKLDL